MSKQILTIGGNVGSSVSMKLLPAMLTEDDFLRPMPGGRRRVFAHLKLQAESIETDALDHSPTIKAVACASGFKTPASLAAANLTFAEITANGC